MSPRLPIYTPQQAQQKAEEAGASSPKLGTIAVVNLGCPKNVVDSEVVLGLFAVSGYQSVGDCAEADVIVVNTCAFLESAVEESIDRILEYSEYKKSGRCRQLIVTGCLVERYADELSKELPEVDSFVPLRFLENIAAIDRSVAQGACNENYVYDEHNPRVLSTPSHYAYLKIADGCNRPCAFCIIPRLRGRYRSRTIESVQHEFNSLWDIGVKEFNLVAQDTTAFGSETANSAGLLGLLQALEGGLDSSALFWIRILYAYPEGVGEELIRFIEQSRRVCHYLDLPFQHVSQNVLKSMRRPLGAFATRELVESIHQWGPSLKLRTTFLLGFPGETQADVDELEAFVLEGHFAQLGVFPFSPEPESAASSLEDSISLEDKEERCSQIMAAQQKVLERTLDSHVGQRLRVLVDGSHQETDLLLVGRTEWQAPEVDNLVLINDAAEEYRCPESGELSERLAGRFVEVEITEVAGSDLVGTVVKLPN